MTKQQLKTELDTLGVKYKAKASVAELEALLKAASKPQHFQAPEKAKRGPSVKQTIRSMFPRVGSKRKVEEVLAACATAKPETVVTMLADLKNPKYAGSEGVVKIERDNGHFVRTA